MKVFISWSGEQGKAFAGFLHAWIRNVLQAVKPFFSPDDIAKGARWAADVGAELDASNIGIIVVTPESLAAPWVMFEAGALSKNVGTAKVVPILVGLEPDDVRGPLEQFQHARVDPTDMKRLIRMLNSELRDIALTDDRLERAFTKWWPELESQVSSLLSTAKGATTKEPTDRELLEEIVSLARTMAEPKREPVSTPTVREERAPFSSGALTMASVLKRVATGGNLVGANLHGVDLAHQDLAGANLKGANLVRADLSGARLIGANLDGANLEGALLDGADL
jgi:hypothetical protein